MCRVIMAKMPTQEAIPITPASSWPKQCTITQRRSLQPHRHIGRPSCYTEELAGEICKRIAEGRSLRSVCRDMDMPAASTIYLWLQAYVDFSEQYALARDIRADAILDEILDIARAPLIEIEISKANGTKTTITQDNINLSRLRISVLKWKFARMRPRKERLR